jgi:Mg2+-importing ATPase
MHPRSLATNPDHANDGNGLSSREAARRLRRFGRNVMNGQREAAWPQALWRQLGSPLVLILVVAAAISMLLRDWTEAAIVLAIVAGTTGLGLAQELRATHAVERLRRRLALEARVVRDGREQRIPASRVVPGDVLLLAAGNLVPADALLLEAKDFLVNEAALTGESMPVEKRPGTLPADMPLAQRSNCVFVGSSVRSGSARVLVTATGASTAFGEIAAQLARRAPESEFARGVRQFGELLLRVMIVMLMVTVAANQWLGRPLVDSLLFALALAVGLSPELLPAIVSITLSHGAREMARSGVLVRHLDAIENLGSIDVLCTDKTGTLTAARMALHAWEGADGTASARVRDLAFVNAAMETGIANPLDAAIVEAGKAASLTIAGWRKVDEIPYDFQRRRLTIVAVEPHAADGKHLIVTKGAFDHVLAVCTTMAAPGGEAALDDEQRERLRARFREASERGMRVLALATRRTGAQPAYEPCDEHDMCFEGMLHFFDPPKPEAAHAVRALAQLGIAIKVITGDNRHVAAHVAATLGLPGQRLMTGAELAAMRDEALWQQAPRTDLFVEVDPQQKERIVRALQRTGHAVGYLGDGINDAPALHAADVGISVDSAVDVARESADIVLLKPDLDVLQRGVVHGRHTFANTLKYICITTSANFGNMLSMAVGALFLPYLPLAAKQILLNNLLSDVPSIAISTDRVDPGHLAVPQRWNMKEVRRFMVVFGLVSTVFDLLTFVLLVNVFHADEATFQTAWFVVSLLTELAVVLALRTRGAMWRSAPSPLLLGSTLAVAAVAIALPLLAPVRALFGFVTLPAPLVLALGAVVIGYLATTEAVKVAWLSGPGRRLTQRKAAPAPHSTVLSRWNSPTTIPRAVSPPKRLGDA